jgi:hypothetical protein
MEQNGHGWMLLEWIDRELLLWVYLLISQKRDSDDSW